MTDETEYELNTLCQKLITVLESNKSILKRSQFNKSFSPTFKKVKKQNYVKFNDFLTDIKGVFSKIKVSGNVDVSSVEQAFAKELKDLINMDYFEESANHSDTSDSITFPKIQQTPVNKGKKFKTTPKQGKIKIKLKLTPNRLDTESMSNFDYDENTIKVQELCTSLLKSATVSNAIQKNFNTLPNKDLFGDYYEIIQRPISLTLIKDSINTGLYTSLYHCYSDLLIMCLNAKTYNEPHTAVYDLSINIIESINSHMPDVSISNKMLKTSINPELKLIDYKSAKNAKIKGNQLIMIDLWHIFTQVLVKCNKSGRPLTTAFLILPDVKDIPIYYQEIANPMSLCGIRSRIICCKYATVTELLADLNTLCENAIQFNKKSSIIHKDASGLRDFVSSLFKEYTEEETGPTKVGEKRRATQIAQSSTPSLPTKSPKSEVKAKISETHCAVEDCVMECFKTLKNSGPGLHPELVQACTMFHKPVADIYELEDILQEESRPRNLLLKIICSLMSRLDPLCVEYSTIEDSLKNLVDVDSDVTELFGCVPTYQYQDNTVLLQEELMSIFRWTAYSKILRSQSSNILRISKPKSDILSDVPKLDVLSEDIVLVDYNDVKRILITPLSKFKKPKTEKIKVEPSVTPKSERVKTPKKEFFQTPKRKLIKDDGKQKKGTPSECKIKAEPDTDEKPVIKKICLSKAVTSHRKEELLTFINNIKLTKDSTGSPLFDDFFEVPLSKTYHSIIKFPMCLRTITKYIDEEKYTTWNDIISACLLIVQNARYYNEESADVFKTALTLQKMILSKASSQDTSECIANTNKIMLKLMEDLSKNTDVGLLTESTNSKIMAVTFRQLYEKVLCGYYTGLSHLQDDLLHILISLLNENQFNVTSGKILSVFRYYLLMRDKVTQLKSNCFDLTMESFVNHYQDRLDVVIPEGTASCITYSDNTYMVGDKVLVRFSEDDAMVLHINNINPPSWVSGTVYLMADSTLYKTEIKDVVHMKYVVQKITTQDYHNMMAYNYRHKTMSNIQTHKPTFCRVNFKSFYGLLAMSKYNKNTIVHGTADHKTYFLQFMRDNGDVFKVGDFVYLKSESEMPYIARIDKIHRDSKDNVHVFGPWFIRPSDTKYYDSKQFYPNEVLMSSITDMNHINSVEGICTILHLKDYITRHPTNILSKDVYICDNKYDETTHKFSKLVNKLYINGPSKVDREPSEWYVYDSPKKCQKAYKPPFYIPEQYDTVTSSEDDESSSDESYSDKPIPRVVHTQNTPRGRIVQSTPRARLDHTPNTPRARLDHTPNTPRARLEHTPNTPRVSYMTINRPRGTLHHTTVLNRSVNNIANVNSPLLSNGIRANVFQARTTPQTVMAGNRNVNNNIPAVSPKMRCHWNSCTEAYADPNDYYRHIINTQTHLSSENIHWRCFWDDCSDLPARRDGCGNQVLLRRHLLQHMKESGYKPVTQTKPIPILRHSETYKVFLKSLIAQKRSPHSPTVPED